MRINLSQSHIPLRRITEGHWGKVVRFFKNGYWSRRDAEEIGRTAERIIKEALVRVEV